MRFYSVYHSMPVEIRPIETAAMVYYVMTQHSELVLLLRERKSKFLSQLFMDDEEVEENLRACGKIQSQYHLNSKCKAVFTCCPYEEKTVDNFVFDTGIYEQPCLYEKHVYEQLEATVTTVPEMDIFNSYILDEIIVLKVDHRHERQPIFDGCSSDDEHQAYLIFDHYEDSKDDGEFGLVIENTT
jgi:hypothetical protein